ncbi:lamin tail domain-containing protein [Candidatus Parcubacteria bacterium]|nr:lamin tail domain-containing protein [Candidatus Parcubacteria bacterium]
MKIPIDFVGDAEILAKIRESETKNLSANFFQKIKIESYFDQSFVPKEESVKTESKSSLKILINEIQIDSLEGPGGTDDDWVELYNPNNETIFLTGWSIQKHSKSDPCSIETGFYKKNFPDDAQIPPKGFFLIVSTKANENLKNIADMTIGWSLTKDNTIYLVKKQDKILGKEDPDIVDRVGFGNACWPEKNPAPDPEEGKTIERINFQDTDDNSIDFQIQSNPSPKNSKSL